MLRFLTVSVFAATLGVVGILYKIKYDTRSLQREAVALTKQINRERQQLAVLRAEWSILTHPARVSQLAENFELKPLDPQQIISFRDIDALPFKAPPPLAKVDDGGNTPIHLQTKRNLARADRPSTHSLLDVFKMEPILEGVDDQ